MRLTLTITRDEAMQRLRDKVNTENEPEALLFGFGWQLEEMMYGKISENSF